MKAWVRIEATDEGSVTLNANVPIAQALGLLEMGKFAVLQGATRPTAEVAKGEAPLASMRAPAFRPTPVA